MHKYNPRLTELTATCTPAESGDEGSSLMLCQKQLLIRTRYHQLL